MISRKRCTATWVMKRDEEKCSGKQITKNISATTLL
jgi:hypothetical protein